MQQDKKSVKKEINTRDIALSVLMDIETNGTFSNVALAKALKKNQFSDKTDRAFISRLVEGSVERRITIDYIINQFSKTKVNKCKPLIRCILRLGTYQIMYMDKVPDSAACNESVKLAGKHGFGTLSGYVNAVLRRIAAGKDTIVYPDETKKAAYYSIMYSIPEWLCQKLIADYPDKYEAIIRGCFEDRKTTIRVNEIKISVDELAEGLSQKGIAVEKGRYSRKALLIDGYDFIRRIPGYKEGYFSVQDESSMCAVEAAGIKPGDIVIDVCAAPGGKTTLAAEYLNGCGKVYSMDISADKLELIEDNVSRLGLDDVVEISAHDATIVIPELEGKADVVLCDVPCSGLGIIGRKNDIKYRLVESQLEELTELQMKIAHTAVGYLKKGGTLLYSTCTINPRENRENVELLLETHPKLKLCSDRLFLQGVDSCDGFYYAVMKYEA